MFLVAMIMGITCQVSILKRGTCIHFFLLAKKCKNAYTHTHFCKSSPFSAKIALKIGELQISNLPSELSEEYENLGKWLNNFSEHKRPIAHRIGNDTRWKRPQNAFIPGCRAVRKRSFLTPSWSVTEQDPKKKDMVGQDLFPYIWSNYSDLTWPISRKR